MKNLILTSLLLCSAAALSGCVYEEPGYYHRGPREVVVREHAYYPEPIVRERVYCGRGGWGRRYCY